MRIKSVVVVLRARRIETRMQLGSVAVGTVTNATVGILVSQDNDRGASNTVVVQHRRDLALVILELPASPPTLDS